MRLTPAFFSMVELLKTWHVGGFTCKLWQESESVLRGCVLQGTQPIACAEVLSHYGQERAEHAVESLVPVMQRPAGIWHITDQTPVNDVVLVPRRAKGPDPQERLREPIRIADDLEVLPVSDELAKLIFDSCDPPGRNKGFSVDLRSPLYAFVRYGAPRDRLHGWDPDGRLKLLLALSRFIRPTSASTEYAVRVVGDVHRGPFKVIPGPVRGIGSKAWTSTPGRDWLTPSELGELREALAAFEKDPFPKKSRLSHAMWYHEYAAQTYYVDLRWTLCSTALETLLSTDSTQSTRHFTKRLPQLAEQVGAPAVSNSEASKMWGLRSALVHGAKHGGLKETDFSVYNKMETVLRLTLRRAVVDLEFRAMFSTDQQVNATFPVPPVPPKTVTCSNCQATIEVPR